MAADDIDVDVVTSAEVVLIDPDVDVVVGSDMVVAISTAFSVVSESSSPPLALTHWKDSAPGEITTRTSKRSQQTKDKSEKPPILK